MHAWTQSSFQYLDIHTLSLTQSNEHLQTKPKTTDIFPTASGVRNAEHPPHASRHGMKVLISVVDQIRVWDRTVKTFPLEDEGGGVCRDSVLLGLSHSPSVRVSDHWTLRKRASRWKFSIRGKLVSQTLQDMVIYLDKEDFISYFVRCAWGRVYLNGAFRINIAFVSWGVRIKCHEVCYLSWVQAPRAWLSSLEEELIGHFIFFF